MCVVQRVVFELNVVSLLVNSVEIDKPLDAAVTKMKSESSSSDSSDSSESEDSENGNAPTPRLDG